ncbi:MAG: methylenetetrahydrofolate--tRNA-(uracil(54)-C(5))-methyltransferase (FADH(2)-oxidizing) TrmFO [Blastocatellia bacterium AA13]|nr:MAG: methylenetetrahydrofolate--tRNA-(uracil(54)-C(5))-methyltransferase (FADH(2)-oxidizing) TrmFO [Blastocatellia bacterium AA13]
MYSTNEPSITVIGGGLAGSEAAWQAAHRGAHVRLFEMRPVRPTPAHQSSDLAEIVCSNSLKSDEPGTAPYLLKEELRRGGSMLIEAAHSNSVPAGTALAVDREKFAEEITRRISANPNIEIIREELTSIPDTGFVIIATGPLTSPALSEEIAKLTGSEHLYFYDAISPIVDADTIDNNRTFRAARYGKGGDDYLNCAFNEEEYASFYEALLSAESVPLHEFEKTMYFEACLPIEELARRGRDTLRYGPMKPVGLRDPRTGLQPFAAVQLRQENLMADSYNLVGFQNHLRFGEQKRVLRLIPGLEQAEFIKFGQIHRNTFICAPAVLTETLRMRDLPRVFFAGQISGVEGYIEAIATGFMAGVHAAEAMRGRVPEPAPRMTAMGSLANYISRAETKNFQPMNITFALLPALASDLARTRRKKADRRRLQVDLALQDFETWKNRYLLGEYEATGNAQS